MAEQEAAKEEFDKHRTTTKQELQNIQEKLKNTTDDKELGQLQSKLKELELKQAELDSKAEELRLKEKKTPWNVDTISKPGFEKTVINTKAKPSYDDLTDEEKEVKMRDFVKDNKKIIEQYGMLRRYDDSRKFLLEHSHLACESTANYLVIWCINLQMEKKSKFTFSG